MAKGAWVMRWSEGGVCVYVCAGWGGGLGWVMQGGVFFLKMK